MSELVEVDSRRRVTLGAHAKHTRYLLTTEPDGTVVLTPAVVMTEHEARLLARPDVLAQIKADIADPSRLTRRRKV